MKSISLRGIDDKVKELLQKEATRAGISVNALLLNLIHKGIGHDPTCRSKNYDLDRLAGTWTTAEAEEFFKATEVFEKIDQDLWK